MKFLLFSFTLLSLSAISSCRKDVTNPNQDIIGNWIWTSSHSSTGTRMFANDSSRTFSIAFTKDYHFSNTAYCIVGGPTEGTFEVKEARNGKILILKSQYNTSDSLELHIESIHLMLTDTYYSYSWFHDFYKK